MEGGSLHGRLLTFPPAVWSAESGRTGVTLYVSKLGDNSTGRAWQTALRRVLSRI